jgi:hypothetical protein
MRRNSGVAPHFGQRVEVRCQRKVRQPRAQALVVYGLRRVAALSELTLPHPHCRQLLGGGVLEEGLRDGVQNGEAALAPMGQRLQREHHQQANASAAQLQLGPQVHVRGKHQLAKAAKIAIAEARRPTAPQLALGRRRRRAAAAAATPATARRRAHAFQRGLHR